MWNSLLLVFTVPTGLVIILAAIYMHYRTGVFAHIISVLETGSERGWSEKLGVTGRLV